MLRFLLRPAAIQFNNVIAGGSLYELAVRGAKRKHLRIAARKKREAENKIKRQQKKDDGDDKKEFVPYRVRLMMQAGPPKREEDSVEHLLSILPEDNVWQQKYHARQVYTFAQAVQWHKETLDPSVFDRPDALLRLNIEFNMITAKKTKFIEKVSGILRLPHPISDEVLRRVMAVGNDAGERERAVLAGADLAITGSECASRFESGDLTSESYEYFLCQTDAVLDLVRVRGLMKFQFPDKKKGTMGNDLYALVSRFAKGIEFAAEREFLVKEYAKLMLTIGRVDMPYDQLLENVRAAVTLLLDLRTGRGPGKFINRCEMLADGSDEKFKVDLYECLTADVVAKRTFEKPAWKMKKKLAKAAEQEATVDSGAVPEKTEEVEDNETYAAAQKQ